MAEPPTGVVTVPPSAVHLDIHKAVQQALQGVKDGQTMAVVNVQTGRGVNLAIAHRERVTTGVFKGDWIVETWVGKSGWQQPVEGGATLAWSR